MEGLLELKDILLILENTPGIDKNELKKLKKIKSKKKLNDKFQELSSLYEKKSKKKLENAKSELNKTLTNFELQLGEAMKNSNIKFENQGGGSIISSIRSFFNPVMEEQEGQVVSTFALSDEEKNQILAEIEKIQEDLNSKIEKREIIGDKKRIEEIRAERKISDLWKQYNMLDKEVQMKRISRKNLDSDEGKAFDSFETIMNKIKNEYEYTQNKLTLI